MKNIINTIKKDKKAITLIALVITIVILIILATVVINLSLGDNGIFNRAREAKEQYNNSQEYEDTEIAKVSNDIDSYVGGGRLGFDSITLLAETNANSYQDVTLLNNEKLSNYKFFMLVHYEDNSTIGSSTIFHIDLFKVENCQIRTSQGSSNGWIKYNNSDTVVKMDQFQGSSVKLYGLK